MPPPQSAVRTRLLPGIYIYYRHQTAHQSTSSASPQPSKKVIHSVEAETGSFRQNLSIGLMMLACFFSYPIPILVLLLT